MAPYRSSRTSNRQTRTTQIDHDVFEGLPVRHWRKKPVTAITAPEKDPSRPHETSQQHGWPDLPLPRDFSMLPENSQALLRAARMGLMKKQDTADEDKDHDEAEPAHPSPESGGFPISKWSLVPREVEGPEYEYLAKRRKGLSSGFSGTNGIVGPIRKTKIKKVDVTGNMVVWEVLVPEGQTVEGEMVEDDTSPTSAFPGTVVDGFGVINSDGLVVAGEQAAPVSNRKKPPIPKKKKKHGPGRGKKKPANAAAGIKENGTTGLDTGAQALDYPNTGHEGGLDQQHEGAAAEGADHHDENEGSEEGSEDEADDQDGEVSSSPDKDMRLGPEDNPTLAADDPPSSELERSTEKDSPSTAPGPAAALDTKMDIDEPAPSVSEAPPATDLQHGAPAEAFSAGDTVLSSDAVRSGSIVEPLGSVEDQPMKDSTMQELPPTLDQQTLQPFDTDPSANAGPASSLQGTPAIPALSETRTGSTPDASLLEHQPSTQALPHSTETSTAIPSIPPAPSQLQSSQKPLSSHLDQNPGLSTSTPEAPTPSPPTPIGTAFPPDLSPKAPTMSPPTPVAIDADSPAEAPLPEKLPPLEDPLVSLGDKQNDPAAAPPIPGLQSSQSPPRPVDVEAAPPIPDPHLDAEIPHAHNPLDGLAPPSIPPPERTLDAVNKGDNSNSGENDTIAVEAAPTIDQPTLNAEIPHAHNPLDGLQAPTIPPEQRRLDRDAQVDKEADVERFEDGDVNLMGTYEREKTQP